MSDPTRDQKQAILIDLLATNADPRRIARKRRVSLEQIAQIIDDPETGAVIHAIRTMSDATAAIAIGRARLGAIQSLRSIAADRDTNPESARKASVDLIKSSPAPLTHSTSINRDTEPKQSTIDDATRSMLREALDAFASEPTDNDNAG